MSRPSTPISSRADLWVPNLGEGTLTRLDPASAAVLETLTVGGEPIVAAAGAGDLWVTNFAGKEVWRIHPS